jgi:hypothetical protein
MAQRNRPDWLRTKNERRIERLVTLTPKHFPQAVWTHALAAALVPDRPGKAVESYWLAHPIRADRLARAMARRSGAPDGWIWRLRLEAGDGLPASFRTPPLPFREAALTGGPGTCCVCGGRVFRYGWHRDLWGDGRPNARANWHAACVSAWKLWTAPHVHDRLLKRLQGYRCAMTRRRLLRDAEVDHAVPLFRVWRDRRDTAWPDLLAYWGLPNLQVITREAHLAKCASEARERARLRTRLPLAAESMPSRT